MKNLLLITAIISFMFSIEDDQILNELNHISTLSDAIESVSDNSIKKKRDFNLSFCLGPLISLDNDEYGSGYSMGYSLVLPTKITIFNNTFSTSIETIFSSLFSDENINGENNSISLISLGLILNSPIDSTPLSFSIGGGYTHHSIHKVAAMGLASISYKLPFENFNVSLDLRLQKVINLTREYELEFNTHSHNLYGINFLFGKEISFN